MWGKIARWLLPVSLALNLFFIVLAVRHHPFLHPHPPDARNMIYFLGSNLPPADAAILQRVFTDHEAEIEAARKTDEDFPEKMRAALTTDPFDSEGLKDALKMGQAGHQKMEDAMAAAFAEAAAKMSPQGRTALAARPQFGPRGGGQHGPGFFHERFDGPPPPPPPPPPN